jgi:hypothetical protein
MKILYHIIDTVTQRDIIPPVEDKQNAEDIVEQLNWEFQDTLYSEVQEERIAE